MASLIILLFAGCGEKDSATTADAEQTSKAAFIRQADAICKETLQGVLPKAKREVGQAAGKANGNIRVLRAELAKKLLAPALRAELEKLRALDVPEGAKQKLARMLAESDAVIDEIEEDPVLLATGKADPFARPTATAKRIGLSACPYGG